MEDKPVTEVVNLIDSGALSKKRFQTALENVIKCAMWICAHLQVSSFVKTWVFFDIKAYVECLNAMKYFWIRKEEIVGSYIYPMSFDVLGLHKGLSSATSLPSRS
jgi:hypothetical protein